MNFGLFGGLTDACYGELLKLGLTFSPGIVKIVSVVLYFLGLYLLSLAVKDKKIKLAVVLTFALSVQSLEIIYATYSLLVPIIFFSLFALYLGFEYISKGKQKDHILTMDLNKYHIFLASVFLLTLGYGWFSGKLGIGMFDGWQSLIIYSLPLLLSLIAFSEPRHHERLPIKEKVATFIIALFGLFMNPILAIIPLIQLIKESYHIIFYSKAISRRRNQVLFLVLILSFWLAYGLTFDMGTSLSWGIFLVIIAYIFIFSVSLDLEDISRYLIYGVALVMLIIFSYSIYPHLDVTIPSNSEIASFVSYPSAYIIAHPNAYAYFAHRNPIVINSMKMYDSKSDFDKYITNVSNMNAMTKSNKYVIISDDELYTQLRTTKNVFRLFGRKTVAFNGTQYTEAVYGNDIYQFLIYLDKSNSPFTYDVYIKSKSGYSRKVSFTKIIPLDKSKGYLGYVVNIDGIENSVLYDWLLHKTPVNNTNGVFVYEYN